MEWVETTGKSVQEAKDLALDRLGVLETEADLEVLEEPRAGMFGRVRGAARVRARVRPSVPPSKTDRQKRKGRASKDGRNGPAGAGSKEADNKKAATGESNASKGSNGKGSNGSGGGRSSSGGRGSQRNSNVARSTRTDREPMPEDEQRSVGEEFLTTLLEAFGYVGTVSSSLDSQGILAFDINGEQLGLMIGPGLNTMDAIQEVCRNAIQRQADGREYGKVVLDVNGVRKDRTTALENFVRAEAATVAESGDDVIFEVMSRSDRKIVHDVIADLDGVSTESVGEDPRRRVVLHSS